MSAASSIGTDQSVVINSVGPMGSPDPFSHDALNSTIIFKNVYPRLVNLGLEGAPTPFLASSWQVSHERLHWTFEIRPDALFENDQPITPEVIGKNLKRILWLSRNDKTQLHTKILGFSKWTQLSSDLPGIQWNSHQLILNFKEPPEELLETLDQAIFGVVPLTDFDPHSGIFKATRATSGGYYRISETAEDHIQLTKNTSWKVSGPSNMTVRWDAVKIDDLTRSKRQYDIVISNGVNLTDSFQRHHFKDNVRAVVAPPFLMNFVQLNAHKDPFKSAALRRRIQAAFYAQISSDPRAKELFSLSNSFLPKGTPGYTEHPIEEVLTAEKLDLKKKVRLVWWPPSQIDEANDLILAAIQTALEKFGLELDIYRCRDRKEMIAKMRSDDFDVMVRLTGVLIRNPFSDMRLMFQSKMGAKIPDLTGKCAALLDAADKEHDPVARRKLAEKINQQVFEDASILTYSHSGFVYIMDTTRVSISRFNLNNDPFDFTSIELKSVQ